MRFVIHYPSVYGFFLLLAAINSSRCEERRDFYDYGVDAGDQVLPLGDESKSPPVRLPTRFRYFDTYYDVVHVRKFAKLVLTFTLYIYIIDNNS